MSSWGLVMLHKADALAGEFRPRFSGHETFPFRYDWLRKVLIGADDPKLRGWVSDSALERQMVAFGVGKNMVRSMLHWASATKVAVVVGEEVTPTEFGRRLLLEADPYLESIGTSWALHWQLATNAVEATSWYWMFNLYPSATVNVRMALDELKKFSAKQNWRSVSENTLRRDLECFLRCYAMSRGSRGELTEDSIECPLAELELLRPQSDRRVLEFQRGPKPTLPDGVFAFALNDFWGVTTTADTLSFDQIAHSMGSPGRVFKMDESSLLERLERLDAVTSGAFKWVDTAGVQQVVRSEELKDPISLVAVRKERMAA